MTPEGRYLDADPVALDLYGVTLDVLRESSIGDFSPPQFAELEKGLWSLWALSGLDRGEGGGTLLRGDGTECRVWVGLERLDDERVRIRLRPLDEPANDAPWLRVQAVLGKWRDLERHFDDMPKDDPARDKLRARIEALREEYRKRTNDH